MKRFKSSETLNFSYLNQFVGTTRSLITSLADSGERYNRNFLGGQSVVNFYGDRHKQRRKLLMPPFHGERMQAYGEIIKDITQQVTSQWKINESFAVRSSTQAISFQVILKAVFGLEDGEQYEKINQLLTKRLEGGKSILRILLLLFPILQKDWGPLSPWGRLKRNQKQIDELIYAEIDERQAPQSAVGTGGINI